jgi:sugar-specific transcriptional regulator TrmB
MKDFRNARREEFEIEEDKLILAEEHEDILNDVMDTIDYIQSEIKCPHCVDEAIRDILRHFFVEGYISGNRDAKQNIIQKLDNELNGYEEVNDEYGCCGCDECCGCEE